MLEQSRTSPKKEVKIKTVPEILLCHICYKTLAKVNIKFKNQILCPYFFLNFDINAHSPRFLYQKITKIA
tara:strand:+ start:85552 stop:85761 length:210 start_codon:yes stop_codon:yes gene_type:complete